MKKIIIYISTLLFLSQISFGQTVKVFPGIINGGTGGGINIYNTDSALASNRTIDLNDNSLNFINNKDYPDGYFGIIPHALGQGDFAYIGDVDGDNNQTVIVVADSIGSIFINAINGIQVFNFPSGSTNDSLLMWNSTTRTIDKMALSELPGGSGGVSGDADSLNGQPASYYLTTTGSAALLTSFPILNQNTIGNSGSVTNGVYTTTFNSLGDVRYYPLSGNPSGYLTSVPAQSFSSLTGKPTTLAGYGITNGYPLTGNPSGFFILPALTNTAVLLSNGSTIIQDASNLNYTSSTLKSINFQIQTTGSYKGSTGYNLINGTDISEIIGSTSQANITHQVSTSGTEIFKRNGVADLTINGSGNILLNNLKTGSTAPATSGMTQMVITDANGQVSFASIPSSGTPLNGTGLVRMSGTTAFYDNTNYAPITSPALLGNPTSPTRTSTDSSTNISTTAFVKLQGYLKSATASSIYQTIISQNTAFNKNFGTTTGTIYDAGKVSDSLALLRALIGTKVDTSYRDSINLTLPLQWNSTTKSIEINSDSLNLYRSGGGSYTLPTASATVLGGIKVGSGLSITSGVLSTTGGGAGMAIGSSVGGSPTSGRFLLTGSTGLLEQTANFSYDSTGGIFTFNKNNSAKVLSLTNTYGGDIYEIRAGDQTISSYKDGSLANLEIDAHQLFINAEILMAPSKPLIFSNSSQIGAVWFYPDASGNVDFGAYGGGNSTNVINIDNTIGFNTLTPNSGVSINTSLSTAYVTKTSSYTLGALDYTLQFTSAATVTLPTASGIAGRIYEIVNSSSGTVIINTVSGQIFTNITSTPATLSMTAKGTYVVKSDGNNWMLISKL